jgi:hypothetical protein
MYNIVTFIRFWITPSDLVVLLLVQGLKSRALSIFDMSCLEARRRRNTGNRGDDLLVLH